jgi:hypothetical protein
MLGAPDRFGRERCVGESECDRDDRMSFTDADHHSHDQGHAGFH